MTALERLFSIICALPQYLAYVVDDWFDRTLPLSCQFAVEIVIEFRHNYCAPCLYDVM